LARQRFFIFSRRTQKYFVRSSCNVGGLWFDSYVSNTAHSLTKIGSARVSNDNLAIQLAELLNELEEVSSELNDIDLDAASELKSAIDEAEQAKSNAEEAVSNLEDVISNLEAISLPDPSDLESATDRLDKAVAQIKELAEQLETLAPKSLTLIVKQGSAEQKFYLHPDSPAVIEIITE
jgi:chromosome segregation ATPase